MKTPYKSVFGIYRDRSTLEATIDKLKAEGFRNTDISVLLPQSEGIAQNLGHEKQTKAPEGASTGAGAGALIGGALGWLIGIGALAIPGLGLFIAAGPLLSTLAGVGIGGTVGGLTGALVGLGVPEYEAKRYEGIVKQGGLLLSVHSDNREWLNKAETLLRQTGAEDVASAGEDITGEGGIGLTPNQPNTDMEVPR